LPDFALKREDIQNVREVIGKGLMVQPRIGKFLFIACEVEGFDELKGRLESWSDFEPPTTALPLLYNRYLQMLFVVPFFLALLMQNKLAVVTFASIFIASMALLFGYDRGNPNCDPRVIRKAQLFVGLEGLVLLARVAYVFTH